MFRRIVGLSLLIAAVFAGAASAEPKNQAPFTRPVDARSIAPSIVDTAPRPEAKNLMPFTRQVVTDSEARPEAKNQLPFTRQVGADATSGASSSGIDWALTAWVALVAIALAGGGFAATRLRVGMHKPA
jgi:hypothetical protein